MTDAVDLFAHRPVGDVLLDAADHMRSVFTRACSAEGLSMAEGRALRFLAIGARQGDLPDLLLCGPSRVTALLQELEECHLIDRSPSRHDRRQKEVRVTARGREVLDEIHARLDKSSPLVLALDDRERGQLHELLLRLAHPRTTEPAGRRP